MARGRKKGGLKIDEINDKEDLKKLIKGQINSLNNKFRKFALAGIIEQYEYSRQMLGTELVEFNEQGNIKKGMKFYDKKHILWLKKTLSALHKLNNHEFYGTVSKYNKGVNESIKGIKSKALDILDSQKYDDKFKNEVVNSKDFYDKFYNYVNENSRYKLDSNTVIEKIMLEYENTGIDEQTAKRLLSDIEYAINTKKRAYERMERFKESERNSGVR